MMNRFRPFAALAVLLLSFAALAAPAKTAPAKAAAAPAGSDVLPFHASVKTLPNGLRVIVVPTGFPNLVSIQIPVKTGSRNEVEPGKTGFAHFFEHMMFRGTEKYPPEKYNEIITKAGARQNAYTTNDYTNFYETFAKEDLPKILEIEADRFEHLSYSPEAFKTEARAVLGEYNKNSASPIQKLIEVQHEAAFTTHTYKHTTMGFIKDIEDMPNQYDYSKQFFARWYRPENVTIIVAGDVKPEEVFPLVEKYWGNWKPGTYKAAIPQEPPAQGPVYAHVPWASATLPWVTVAFHGPAFSETQKDQAAIDVALDLAFGDTSELHKRLVEQEQKVDRMFADGDDKLDPGLITVFARLKNINDANYVRDEILKTFAQLRDRQLPADRINDAKSNSRYALLATLDNTEAIASTLATFVEYNRSYDTINNYFRTLAAVTPADIQAAARKYITDSNLVVTTLSKDPMPAGIDKAPSLASLAPAAKSAGSDLTFITQKSVLPQIEFKLLFNTGSVDDPAGKEGLARLASSMITDAGSKDMRIDEVNKALFPIAGRFNGQVDKEMTTITGGINRDNWRRFFDVVMPMLLTPGFRDKDFQRLKDAQLNALKQDLRASNDEELGKEELQNRLYVSTPYGHTALGTVAGINSITLDDVKSFIANHYTRANLVVGLSGDFSDALRKELEDELSQLPAGGAKAAGLKPLAPIPGHQPAGIEVEIVKKETRATAISMGFPIPITRASGPDFAALNLARAYLGEHRASSGRLYQRIREIRGMNYGDYAYIEFFTRPGQSFFPSPNVARRSQAFEIWIRPVVPVNAHMATRIALYELQKLIDQGISQADFDATRDYLMKNVYLLTSTQNQRLGYALDSWWFGIPGYTEYMRGLYSKLTRDDVNAAIRKYLSAKNVSIVMVTKDAEGLRDQLLKDDVSTIQYDAPKPADIVEEDKVIGSYKLNLKPENVTITPVEDVFAK